MRRALFALLAAAAVCLPGGALAAECLRSGADNQSAEGGLERVRFVDVEYGNRVEFALILMLAKPACLEGPDEYDQIPSTLKIHVFSTEKALLDRLQANIGRQIRVLGSPFGEHTAHHRAPIVMRVTAVQSLP